MPNGGPHSCPLCGTIDIRAMYDKVCDLCRRDRVFGKGLRNIDHPACSTAIELIKTEIGKAAGKKATEDKARNVAYLREKAEQAEKKLNEALKGDE